MSRFNLCAQAGCNRHAKASRDDGLCNVCGDAQDDKVTRDQLLYRLRRDQTPETESICDALRYLLGEPL
jgi:hypothetical protein